MRIRFDIFVIVAISTIRLIGQQIESISPSNNIFIYTGYNWTPGEAIGLRYPTFSGNSLPQTMPTGNTLFTPENSNVNFSVRFSDLDDANCSKGTFQKQFVNPYYKIEFASSSNGAVFNNGSQTIEVLIAQYQLFPNPLTPLDQYFVFFSENAILNILSTWDKKPFNVTLTLTDRSSTPTMPNGESGNPDDPAYIYSWTINYLSNCPSNMIKIVTAPENTWTAQPFLNTYGIGPNPPPAYQGIIITENFSDAVGCGLFTLNDLNPVWLAANNDVIDENTAVSKIFLPTLHSNSFTVNNLNQIQDFHDGLNLNLPYYNNLQNYFKLSAIQADKAGYKIFQKFKCGSNIIGDAEISKRYKYSIPIGNLTEFKKTHSF